MSPPALARSFPALRPSAMSAVHASFTTALRSSFTSAASCRASRRSVSCGHSPPSELTTKPLMRVHSVWSAPTRWRQSLWRRSSAAIFRCSACPFALPLVDAFPRPLPLLRPPRFAASGDVGPPLLIRDRRRPMLTLDGSTLALPAGAAPPLAALALLPVLSLSNPAPAASVVSSATNSAFASAT